MEALSLIDVSAEDDLFLGLASPPALTQPPGRDPPRAGFRLGAAEAAADLVPAGGSPAAANPYGATGDQAAPELAESPKQQKAKTGVNLRKSLAWDSAFFTSEGVLDTEELAIVNSTFRKTQGSRLPGITEESRRSGESTTSTLESESWAMESIETELFDNVRASIQRSLGKPNKVTAGPPATSKPPGAAASAPHGAGRKVIDQMLQIKARASVSTSQGVGSKQKPQATSNKPTRVTLTEDKEAKPSSRPPRALPRVATMRSSTNISIASGISGKRSSTGGVANNRQPVGKSANTSAGVRPGGVMKPSSVPKTGALKLAATMLDTKNNSATLSSTKRTAQRIPVRSSSKSDCLITKPTRSSGNKIPAKVHNDHASPTISPSSSIDSMSSVISGVSTASTAGKISHTSESFSSLSPSFRKSNDHPLTTKLRPPTVTEGQQSSGTAASEDSLIATAGTTNKGKGAKPSGLRRPNPKIGYFDAEKSTDQVQSLKIQRLLPSTPKSKLPSTQMMSAASSSFGQQEPKSTAPPEESGASKSRAVMAFAIKVAQMDAVPLKMAEPEACTHQTGPVVAEPEAEKSIVQTVSAQVSIPVAQMETIASTSEVAEPEACSHKTGPVVAEHEAEKSIDQNIGVQVQGQEVVALKVEKAELFDAVKTEVVKVENEAFMHQTSPPATATEASKENIPALHQNIQANDDASSLSVELLIQKLSSVSLGPTPDMTF